MKPLGAVLLAIVLLLSACTAPASVAPGAKLGTIASPVAPESNVLTVFAASSLTDAFLETGKNFEASQSGVTVAFNFSASQTLRTQIEQGAQVDVFASANIKEMDALVAGRYIGVDSPKIFLTNQLVVIMPEKNPAGIERLEDLSNSGLKLVLAAKEVPVGNYSLQVLNKLDQAMGNGYQEKVLANVVSYENTVKQVVAKVQLGEADAGMVYSSDCTAAPELQKIQIPVENNVVATYPIAALEQSKNPELAQAFVAYVLSPEGQFILKKWGFLPLQ